MRSISFGVDVQVTVQILSVSYSIHCSIGNYTCLWCLQPPGSESCCRGMKLSLCCNPEPTMKRVSNIRQISHISSRSFPCFTSHLESCRYKVNYPRGTGSRFLSLHLHTNRLKAWNCLYTENSPGGHSAERLYWLWLPLKPRVNYSALLGIVNRCRVTRAHTHTGSAACSEMCDKVVKYLA